jgi:hypothetical protein
VHIGLLFVVYMYVFATALVLIVSYPILLEGLESARGTHNQMSKSRNPE